MDGFQVPHHDGAGVIDAVGHGVDAQPYRAAGLDLPRCRKSRQWGTAAQWSVLPSRQAVPLPDRASDELGACLGVLRPSRHTGACSPMARSTGKSVLVAGGAKAVGHFAIELAKFFGARVVTDRQRPGEGRAGPAGRRRSGGELSRRGRRRSAARLRADHGPYRRARARCQSRARSRRVRSVDAHRRLRGRTQRSGPSGAQVHDRQPDAALRLAVRDNRRGGGPRRDRHRRGARGRSPDAAARDQATRWTQIVAAH